jgi:hypothetical protein
MTDWMAVYCLCEAKFMAESAGRIGKETLITIAHPDRTTDVSFDDDVIKNLWREKGAPRIPPEAAKIVSEMLKSKFKKLGKTRHLPSQTAADQK